ncbi:unnamed protein product [Acanthoscelides obtectus]|uniref:Uncharacterized protein n=1 Tax=Acanthoscelides obtectus TaxID=200917 RepID=A0A9P0M6I8_ACAOB|nr:unnamed protein product [Acanthoscelides obtectus]CAK1622453.1 hypothetical protein AOBTE_LOCUS1496 [Acanthoscelides obtectus]
MRYIPSQNEFSNYLYGKSLGDFVSARSIILFFRLKMDRSFLEKPVSTWELILPFWRQNESLFL